MENTVAARTESLKICRKCKQSFEGRECKPCRNEYARNWALQNKDKVKANAHASYLRNAEKEKARVKAWREKNLERDRATKAAYKKANPEKEREYYLKAYARDPRPFLERGKAWGERNREKTRLYVINRRARIRADGGVLSKDIVEKLLHLQKSRCVTCATDLTKTGYHLDHIVPVTAGGRNIDSNVQLLCPSCNCSKGAKDPVVFMQSKGYLL